MIELAGGRNFEFQRLHGMGDALYRQLYEAEGYACGVYAPLGGHRELLAYLVRRPLGNGANASFVRAVHNPAVPVEQLVALP